MKKFGVIFLLIALLVSAAIPMVVAQSVNEAAKAEVNDLKLDCVIGFSPTSIAANPFYTWLTENWKSYAEELGVKIMIQDANNDPAKQMSDIENFMVSGVNVLYLDPVDAKGISEYAEQLRQKGIKVVCGSGHTDTFDAYVNADQFDVGYTLGKAAGQWAIDHFGQDAPTKVGIVNNQYNQTLQQREAGFEKGLSEVCPSAQIVGRAKGETSPDGMTAAENLLQANPDIKIIFAVNDAAALGVVEAVKGAGKATDDFAVYGADCSVDALKAIQEGSILRGDVYMGNAELPSFIFNTLLKVYNGEDVMQGKPFVGPENQLVDASNVGDILSKLGA